MYLAMSKPLQKQEHQHEVTEERNPFHTPTNSGTRTVDTNPLQSIKSSIGRIKKVLKSAVGFDPRSGSDLRIWVFNKKGLNLS